VHRTRVPTSGDIPERWPRRPAAVPDARDERRFPPSCSRRRCRRSIVA
jgi:hypothetical protein